MKTAIRASVADASALVAIVFEEPDADRVQHRLEGHSIVVPHLVDYEVANAAWKKSRRHPELQNLILRALARFTALPLRRVGVSLTEVLGLALQTQLSVYDASYLWLARNGGYPLVTLDRRLELAARSVGVTVPLRK